MPQLVENYKSKSAEGISLAFLTVWFLGDLTNFLGAVWAGLVPTVIALAVYFCFADLVLITQCLYYNFINARRGTPKHSVLSTGSESESGERQPLLGPRRSDNLGLPGSRRRSSESQRQRDSQRSSSGGPSLPPIPEENGTAKEWLKHSVSITLVCAAGAAGWAIAWRAGVWKPTPEEDNGNNGTAPMALGAQVLGYLSALAYLGLVSYLVASLSILHIAKTIVVTVLGYLRSSKTTASVHAKVSFGDWD